MIHPAYNKSEIARRYYEKTTGEALTRQEAANRWRKTKPDKKILREVMKEIAGEADQEIKTYT